jgi:hypothetical protein
MFTYKDPLGEIHCGAFFAGELFSDAFNESNPVFSPYSNPNSNTWNAQPTSFSLEVVDDANGTVTVRYHSDPLDAPPARRYLGIDPMVQERATGSIYLAWGTQWTEGQPLEPDVISSELQRQVGDQGIWSTVYEGSATSWTNGSLSYDSSGAKPVLFRARTRDAQSKYSAWSNIFFTRATTINGIEHQIGKSPDTPTHFVLMANYPNPFNPRTQIQYFVPRTSQVTLKVFDFLGREIVKLVDGVRSAGTYTVIFDGSTLTSGTYFYRLASGNSLQTRAMILLK